MNGIVHAGIKPSSILIGNDGHVLISDFQCARFVDAKKPMLGREDARHHADMTEYQAPEQILGWAFDEAVDWWGLGMVLFWMLTGEVRFFPLPYYLLAIESTFSMRFLIMGNHLIRQSFIVEFCTASPGFRLPLSREYLISYNRYTRGWL